MPAATTTSANELREPQYDWLGNLALSTTQPMAEHHSSRKELEQALRISGVLQTSLDVSKIIEIFTHEISKLISYDHILYRNSAPEIEVGFGKKAFHLCTYRLVVSGESLGEILFTRRTKFTPDETALIETLLCGLVYPLRNALLYQKAIEAAHKDSLTQVDNRASMNAVLPREIGLALRHGTELSLLALDIDHFKNINDSHGHTMGDCVIKAVAEAALDTIRSSDIVFRYGGEEFAILLSNTSQEGAMLLAERLREKIAAMEIICDSERIITTVSIGIGCLQSGDNEITLFERADRALYQAKNSGRNCCKMGLE